MSGFACQECGHKFRTVKAAEKAAFGANGCPKCGGSDIDLSVASTKRPSARANKTAGGSAAALPANQEPSSLAGDARYASTSTTLTMPVVVLEQLLEASR